MRGELGWILETIPRAAKQRVLRREASNLKLQEACWGQVTQTAKQTDGWPGNPCRTCVAVVRLAGMVTIADMHFISESEEFAEAHQRRWASWAAQLPGLTFQLPLHAATLLALLSRGELEAAAATLAART